MVVHVKMAKSTERDFGHEIGAQREWGHDDDFLVGGAINGFRSGNGGACFS